MRGNTPQCESAANQCCTECPEEMLHLGIRYDLDQCYENNIWCPDQV